MQASEKLRPVTPEENKRILLDMMRYVHAFCEDNGIAYSLYFGSMLGAVRHKGFIPWDDDMDICMTRPHYEKFLQIFPRGAGQRYSVMRVGDENHHVPYAKICDNRTVLIERKDKPIAINIDLFVIDNEGRTLFEAKVFMRLVSFFIRVNNIVAFKVKPYFSDFKVLVMKVFCRFFRLIGVREERLLSLIARLSAMHSSSELYPYVGAVNASKYNERQILRGEWFRDTELVPFEDTSLRIFSEYDRILKTVYVNYMDLPAPCDRVSHERFERWIKE